MGVDGEMGVGLAHHMPWGSFICNSEVKDGREKEIGMGSPPYLEVDDEACGLGSFSSTSCGVENILVDGVL